MSQWRDVTLGDVLELKRGYDLPAADRREGTVPIVSSSGRTGFHDQAKVQGPGVVTGRYGTLGAVFYIEEDFWPLNTALYVRDFKGNDPRFVAALLTSLELGRSDGAAAVPGVNRNHLHVLPVTVPDLSTQCQIAEVLGSLDDLIENNRRRIALLEQMAQAIYREWFVQFRHPGYEGVPAGLSMLPDGWTVSTLGDALEVLESGTRPRGGVDPAERGVPSVGAENIIGLGKYKFGADKFVSATFFDSMRRGQVRDGDVLLYKDGAHIGRHSMFRDGFPHESCAINEHVFRLRARTPLTQNYLYFWLDDPATVEAIVGLNSNAAQPGISQAKLSTVELVRPPAMLVAEWDRLVEPVLALLFGLAKRNRTLELVRGMLLPRLITGVIDVSRLNLDGLLDESTA